MNEQYGSLFRVLRENKNLSLSSLADDYISKGMISKFERNECDISVSRFFHLLEKIKVKPSEFFLTKHQYKTEGFGKLLTIIQQSVLSGNIKKLQRTLQHEINHYHHAPDIYGRLNCIMLTAIIHALDATNPAVSEDDLAIIHDYLFKCENWGHYELILYANSMAAFPIESVIAFSKSLPQKILLMREVDKILEIGFNTLLNTLDLCLRFQQKEAAQYFLVSLEHLNLPETMLFERTLLKLYTGAYHSKFNGIDYRENPSIQEALMILKLADCFELHAIFLRNIEELFV